MNVEGLSVQRGVGHDPDAAAGGIGGGVVRGSQQNSNFQRVFNDCMRNRGHNVF